MTYLDIFQVIFLVIVFAVSIIGFMKVATSEDKEDD